MYWYSNYTFERLIDKGHLICPSAERHIRHVVVLLRVGQSELFVRAALRVHTLTTILRIGGIIRVFIPSESPVICWDKGAMSPNTTRLYGHTVPENYKSNTYLHKHSTTFNKKGATTQNAIKILNENPNIGWSTVCIILQKGLITRCQALYSDVPG